MNRNLLRCALAFFLVASCGTSHSEQPDAAAPGVDGSPADLAPSPDLTGFNTTDIKIGPIMLKAGEERTVCRYLRLDNAEATNVVRIDAALLPGSHHLIFYKSNKTDADISDPKYQQEFFDCPPLDIGINPFGGVSTSQAKDIPIYIAETQNANALDMPKGVAYPFAAHQLIKIEAHYINASPKPIMGFGTVTVTTAPAGQDFTPADIMFCGSVLQLLQPGVPPGKSALDPKFFQPSKVTDLKDKDIKLFGITTHQHRRGTLMTVGKSTSADDPGTELIHGQPWDNAPFIHWDDDHLVTFAPDEGLRWQCFYDNPDSQTIKFGESAEDNEMCFFWAYYYPSAGRFIVDDCLR